MKLEQNPESRRAVVAQVLTYAAYLKGLTRPQFENEALGSKLSERGFASLNDAVEASDQERAFDAEEFNAGVNESLSSGRFRLVIVLDQAPPELVRLVGYLESVARDLVIDLVTVSAYDIAGSEVLVPQRIDPERPDQTAAPTRTVEESRTEPGSDEFEASIGDAAPDVQPELLRLLKWARSLEREGLVRLFTSRGKSGLFTLLPYLRGENVGLTTIWNDKGASISLWRSALERNAPTSVEAIETMMAPKPLGQGTTASTISDDLLAAIADAYREAVRH